jgi:hypothetical protein
MQEGVARWAVESWAIALGVIGGASDFDLDDIFGESSSLSPEEKLAFRCFEWI